MKRLVIISHTEHYINAEGVIVGWGPTITEINHLLAIFDSITHIAMLQTLPAPASALPYCSDRIRFVALPPLGGKGLKDKLALLWNAPKVIQTVRYWVLKTDYFQLRTPTGIGVYLIPYLSLFVKTKGWYKYAGNWNQTNAPIGYALQRQFLKWQKRPVTINGFWENQPEHCISFENPCLTEEDIQNGYTIRKSKHLSAPLHLCFVGRLEIEKGVERLIEALQQLSAEAQMRIAAVHFVGDGADRGYFERLAQNSSVPCQFYGFLTRQAVHEIYKRSHAIVLPSTASEGFPKVLAEAMNYGCIPIVSDISAIAHYIKDQQQGLLLRPVTVVSVVKALQTLIAMEDAQYTSMLQHQEAVVKTFTFAEYHQHLQSAVLN